MKSSRPLKKVCAVSFAGIALIFWAAQRGPDINNLSDAEVSSRLTKLQHELTPPDFTPVEEIAAVYGQPYMRVPWVGVENAEYQEIKLLTDWRRNCHLFLWYQEVNGRAGNYQFRERPVVTTRETESRPQLAYNQKQTPVPRVITPQMMAAQKRAEQLAHQARVAENRRQLKNLMAIERRYGKLAREQGWNSAPR